MLCTYLMHERRDLQNKVDSEGQILFQKFEIHEQRDLQFKVDSEGQMLFQKPFMAILFKLRFLAEVWCEALAEELAELGFELWPHENTAYYTKALYKSIISAVFQNPVSM